MTHIFPVVVGLVAVLVLTPEMRALAHPNGPGHSSSPGSLGQEANPPARRGGHLCCHGPRPRAPGWPGGRRAGGVREQRLDVPGWTGGRLPAHQALPEAGRADPRGHDGAAGGTDTALDVVVPGEHGPDALLAGGYYQRHQPAGQHGRAGCGSVGHCRRLPGGQFRGGRADSGGGAVAGLRRDPGRIPGVQLQTGLHFHGRLRVDVHRLLPGRDLAVARLQRAVARVDVRAGGARAVAGHSDLRHDARDVGPQAVGACRFQGGATTPLTGWWLWGCPSGGP